MFCAIEDAVRTHTRAHAHAQSNKHTHAHTHAHAHTHTLSLLCCVQWTQTEDGDVTADGHASQGFSRTRVLRNVQSLLNLSDAELHNIMHA